MLSNYKIIKIDEVDSTNNYARGLITEKGAGEGTAVLAENQTSGRGVGDNFWESEKGKNLTFSLILKPEFLKPGKQFLLSMVVSLGIYDFILNEVNSVKIKWPNDIYISEKKIGGILIENIIKGKIFTESIIGIGVNINQEKFLSLAPNPVSLKQITGKEYIIGKCFESIYSNIFSWYEILKSGREKDIHKEYHLALFGLGEWAIFNSHGIQFIGQIVGVDEFGRLKIEEENGKIRLFHFKEVEYVLNGKEG